MVTPLPPSHLGDSHTDNPHCITIHYTVRGPAAEGKGEVSGFKGTRRHRGTIVIGIGNRVR